jgi:NADPH:quinone reductase-like Zn-dependent oxidoreductase
LVIWRAFEMKAVVIREHGEPEKVKIEHVPDPEPKPDEVVVQVHAAGLNHLDIWVRRGRPGVKMPMPHVLGSDGAGTICMVGSSVQGSKLSGKVIINPSLSCGWCEACRLGEQSECALFGIVGLSCPGTFAEKVAVPSRNVMRKPPHLTWDEAGALVLSHLTAWRMVMTKGQVRAGQMVLIHGIGGGVALAALQFAKLAGAEVIATSSSQEKLHIVKQIGADYVINYKETTAIAECVRDITAGRGVDLVVDTVGAATWPVDFAVVRRGGKIVLCGVTSGAVAETDLRSLYWNQVTVLGSTMGCDADLAAMLRAVEAAKMKPVMDRVMSLEDAPQAMQRMETGEQFGKIVLRICE